MIEPSKIAEVMGGPQVLGQPVHSIEDLLKAVERGLPKDALRRTVRRVFARPQEANEVLYRIVPEATYKRRRVRLKARESERTERLARVIAAAEFRIADSRHELFDGAGAYLKGGRWNSPGKRIIYAAQTYAGALLEALVHLNFDEVPDS